jgi:hypothetical protein
MTPQEALRTGYCGPDRNSLTRPAFLRSQENDYRPEPAFRNHLTDRTSLHHLYFITIRLIIQLIQNINDIL